MEERRPRGLRIEMNHEQTPSQDIQHQEMGVWDIRNCLRVFDILDFLELHLVVQQIEGLGLVESKAEQQLLEHLEEPVVIHLNVLHQLGSFRQIDQSPKGLLQVEPRLQSHYLHGLHSPSIDEGPTESLVPRQLNHFPERDLGVDFGLSDDSPDGELEPGVLLGLNQFRIFKDEFLELQELSVEVEDGVVIERVFVVLLDFLHFPFDSLGLEGGELLLVQLLIRHVFLQVDEDELILLAYFLHLPKGGLEVRGSHIRQFVDRSPRPNVQLSLRVLRYFLHYVEGPLQVQRPSVHQFSKHLLVPRILPYEALVHLRLHLGNQGQFLEAGLLVDASLDQEVDDSFKVGGFFTIAEDRLGHLLFEALFSGDFRLFGKNPTFSNQISEHDICMDIQHVVSWGLFRRGGMFLSDDFLLSGDEGLELLAALGLAELKGTPFPDLMLEFFLFL